MARNDRVEENMGLVAAVARGFRGRGVEIKDLIGFGYIGLIRAAELFEPGRGTRFSTYAVYWIRQAIFKGIADTSRTVRVPTEAVRELAGLKHEARARDLPIEAILDAREADGRSTRPKRDRLVKAAAADGAGYSAALLEEVAAAWPAPDDPLAEAIASEQRTQLARALPRLDARARQVLIWRHGLDGRPPLAKAKVARRLGIGWRSMARIERAAIAQLRSYLNR